LQNALSLHKRVKLALTIAVAFFAAFLITSSAASASTPNSTQIVAWQQIARSYFTPVCRAPEVTVTWAATDEPGWAAQALYNNDAGQCEIRLDPVLFPTMTPEMQCNMVVHEYGHLAGLGHSPDPDSIMFAAPHPVIPGCASWRLVSSVNVKKLGHHKHRAQRKRAPGRASSSR
jgi:matrixin